MHRLTILFDIDGTLLTTGGAGQQAMADVVAGRPGANEWQESVTFAGRTDRGIIDDIFRLYGVESTADNVRHFAGRFLPKLREYLPRHEGRVLPAVQETLRCLQQQSHVLTGLLTGNMREAARMKLHHYGLGEFFSFDEQTVGGFGDAQFERDEVARDALASIRVVHPAAEPSDIWIVGDTPNDVRCARAIGANVLAVATGEYSAARLEECQPDLLVEDLTRADTWWELLQSRYGVLRPA